MSWWDEVVVARRGSGGRVVPAGAAKHAEPASFAPLDGRDRRIAGRRIADRRVEDRPDGFRQGAEQGTPAGAVDATASSWELQTAQQAGAVGYTVADRIAEARREGYKVGFEEGFAAGKVAAASAMEDRRMDLVARAAAALEEVVGSVASGRASALAVAQQDAADLAFALTRTLVGRELALATSPGMDAVRRALDLSPSGVDLFVHLNPKDAADLPDLDSMPEVIRRVQGCRLSVVPDPDIEPGGCVVEAGACRIDAQIATALERVRRVLVDSQPAESVPPVSLLDAPVGLEGLAGC
ncbi:MAG: FliH/SctL family protein [Acidimicrobiales bacterium]